jgi:hypothetical protein
MMKYILENVGDVGVITKYGIIYPGASLEVPSKQYALAMAQKLRKNLCFLIEDDEDIKKPIKAKDGKPKCRKLQKDVSKELSVP